MIYDICSDNIHVCCWPRKDFSLVASGSIIWHMRYDKGLHVGIYAVSMPDDYTRKSIRSGQPMCVELYSIYINKS
jgi:hypothetical protein